MSEHGETSIFFAPVVSRMAALLEAEIIGSINNPQYFVLSFIYLCKYILHVPLIFYPLLVVC